MNILLTAIAALLEKFTKFIIKRQKHKILCLSRSNDQTIKKKYFYLKCDLKILKNLKNKIRKFDPNTLIHLAWENIPNLII